MGTADIEETIVRAASGVSGIVPIVATLRSLSEAEVVAMLALRYERLRAEAVVPPVEEAVARRGMM